MKKIFYSIATAAIALSLTACGGKKAESAESAQSAQPSEENYDDENVEVPTSATVTIAETAFEDGDLAEFIELVPGDYDVNYEDFEILTSVKVRALAQSDREVSYFTVNYYDEGGNQLTSETIVDGIDAINEALKSGDTVTEIEIPVHLLLVGNGAEAEFMNTVKTVKGDYVSEDTDGDSSEREVRTIGESYENQAQKESDTNETETAAYSNATYANAKDLEKSAAYKQFLSDGKSGNIDKMIKALQWLGTQRSAIRSKVRDLNENAIGIAVALDKASEEIGKKYDAFSLKGALNDKTNNMTNAQLTAYNNACANDPVFFTVKESDLSGKYNTIYRKLRYNSPF